MKVITIEREYGAGGHTIGRAVAQRLGVEFYDRDIISQAAKASGLESDQVEKEEESLSKMSSFIRAITPDAFDIKDTIFEYESGVVLAFAKKEPCVILGRCAGAILTDEGVEHLSVFLRASEESRIPRAKELLNTDDDAAARRTLRKVDAARTAYYSCYIGRKWDDSAEYQLILDTGALSTEACVDIICRAAQE